LQRKTEPSEFYDSPFAKPNMGESSNGTKPFVRLTESGSSIKKKPEDWVQPPNGYTGQEVPAVSVYETL
jgi:hypothetical protein